MAHNEKAQLLFLQKFHCSQSVLAAFAHELGLNEKQALRLGACFGSGMSKGEVCGACVGALMVLGLKYGQDDASDSERRMLTNRMSAQYLDMFREKNGSYICNELLGCDISTPQGVEYARRNNLFTEFCPKMVSSAVETLEEFLTDYNDAVHDVNA